jgi:hypothetical protein
MRTNQAEPSLGQANAAATVMMVRPPSIRAKVGRFSAAVEKSISILFYATAGPWTSHKRSARKGHASFWLTAKFTIEGGILAIANSG